MRTVIILAGMIVADSINNNWHRNDEAVISFVAFIFTIAMFMDVAEFIKKILKNK